MRIEQYFLMTDYSLWEVILNGDSLVPTRVVEGVIQPVAPTTTEQSTTDSVSAAATVSAVCAELPVSSLPNVDSLSNAMAMLTMRARRFLQKTGKNLGANGTTSMGFDMSKVECFNCHRKGHFARECRSPKDSKRTGAAEPFQPSGGYHAVPPLYTGTFMPPKTNLVFNTAPTAVETDHYAFNVQLSPTKPEQDLSHTTRPSAPIIKDWVSDSEDESETKAPQFVPNFVQSSKQVKSPRHTVQPIETSIPAATLAPASPKSTSSGKRRNWKTCFVCKSVDHLIKDCDYHAKKMAQPTQRNYAHRGNHKQYASLTHQKPQKHMVPTIVLTQSKPIFNTAVRLVSANLPRIMVTQPRLAHPIATKSKSPIRRHITRSPSLKTSKSPPRVIAAPTSVVSAAQGIQGNWGNPQYALKDKGVIDSGCSKHMIGNMSYLSDFEELNGGYVAFGGNPKGGKISGKGKIKTGKLDFEDVYFVKDLKFNLFSVSQMCDKKNSVLFTDIECLVLSFDFKLPDESRVLLRVPRENNMYNVNFKNIVPSGDLTFFFVKATIDESNLWHRRLAHINFKTINKLVKGNHVRGLLTKVFENNNTCVACKKGKQHRASCKTKPVLKGNFIEVDRTMLADSLLSISFWVEAVNTARYVQNRVLVTKPHNKTPYELLHGRSLSIGFMRPFGYPVTILNTLDPLGKFEGKFDEGFLVGYSVNSKAFRVFNSRTRIVQETLHVNFLENKPNVAGSDPTWLFDIDSLTRTMNYQPVIAGNQANPVQNYDGDAAFDDNEHDFDAKKPKSKVILSPSSSAQSRKQDDKTKKEAKGKSPVESFT
nr:ribonuclease H-like domain-containing protein [Tanacetum cinerariifolium]